MTGREGEVSDADGFARTRSRWLVQVASDGNLVAASGVVAILLSQNYANRAAFDKDGMLTAWPGLATLSRDSGRSEKTLRAAIHSLIERGHMDRKMGSGKVSSRYLMKLFTTVAEGGSEKGRGSQKGTPPALPKREGEGFPKGHPGGAQKGRRGVPKRAPDSFEDSPEEPFEELPEAKGPAEPAILNGKEGKDEAGRASPRPRKRPEPADAGIAAVIRGFSTDPVRLGGFP